VCGGLLELLGVWAVAKELLETRSVFEAHPIRAEIGDEAKRGATLLRAKIMAVFGSKQPVDIAARGVSAGSGWVVLSPTIKASGVVGETADQRLERIETSISQLWAANARLAEETRKTTAETLLLMKAETTERTNALAELSALQRSVSVGDLQLAVVGLLWLVVGIAVETWPVLFLTPGQILAPFR
jgi:hypothetical protein